VLSETEISESSATGSLMRELFANFAVENIFQITAYSSPDEVAKQFKQKVLINFQSGGVFPLRRLFSFLGFSFRFNPKYWKLYKDVLDFQPDIIYVRVAENLFPFSDLAISVSRYFQIPIISHVMDDYELPFKHSKVFHDRILRRWLFRSDLKKLFKASGKVITISPLMAQAFKYRYGIESEVAHNGVDSTEWPSAKGYESNQERVLARLPFTIVMAGSIDDKKDAQVIRLVARVVDKLNRSGVLKCSLILNVSAHYLQSAKAVASVYMGVFAQQYLPLAKYRSLLCCANCLLLARNFDELTKAYTGLSFHNKLPEYLASGTTILCIAPEEDGSSAFLKDHKAGVVVNTFREDLIEKAIIEIAQNPDCFAHLSENARMSTFNEFNIHNIRRKFENSIMELTLKC